MTGNGAENRVAGCTLKAQSDGILLFGHFWLLFVYFVFFPLFSLDISAVCFIAKVRRSLGSVSQPAADRGLLGPVCMTLCFCSILTLNPKLLKMAAA